MTLRALKLSLSVPKQDNGFNFFITAAIAKSEMKLNEGFVLLLD